MLDEKRTVYVRLDEQAFRELLLGHEAIVGSSENFRVRIILADIGWDRIASAVNNAIALR